MDIIAYLKADHRKVAELLKQLEDTTERAEKTRTEVFAKLKKELEIHTTFEEQWFYPTLKQEELSEDLTREAYEEHHVIKTLLKEIESMDTTDPQWLAKLTVLSENIQHHVKEEEEDLFKKAKKVYSEEELDALAVQAAEFKKEVMSR